MSATVKHFQANDAGKDYVVGDIHGCTAEFRALLDKVAFSPAVDRVFSVGDLIDRGPDSMGALRLLNEPWFHAVRGNHEAMMVDALRSDDELAMRQWIANGGAWNYDHHGDELDALLAHVERLPLAIVVGNDGRRFNVVHAEFIGTDDELAAGGFDESKAAWMLWGRQIVAGNVLTSHLPKSPTYVGHSIVDEVCKFGSHRFIDTGAFKPYYMGNPGALTLVEAATGEFVQVSLV